MEMGVPVPGCCSEKQRGREGVNTGLTSPPPQPGCWLCPWSLWYCLAGGDSSALLLQPLHLQDLAQQPLHVLIHVALGQKRHSGAQSVDPLLPPLGTGSRMVQ